MNSFKKAFEAVLPCNDPSCASAPLVAAAAAATPPPNISELGRAGWRLFHSATVCIDDEEELRRWASAFAGLYPCLKCRPGFVQAMQQRPLKGSAAFWGCQLHNDVNEQIGAAVWPCEEDKLNEIYSQL